MDILTVLLLFLLKSFVAEGEVITPAPGIELPESRSETAPQESLVIAIAADRIAVGDEVIVGLDESVDGGLGPDTVIAALADHLRRASTQQRELAARRGHADAWRGKITIQADRDMSFAVLQRVMYTCNQSGFEDVALAVLRG
jgi:biopolymer transport protein ExbD